MVADHLSRIEPNHMHEKGGPMLVNDAFTEDYLMSIKVMPQYAHIVNYLVAKSLPLKKTYQQKKKLFPNLKYYFWKEHFFLNIM